MKHLSTILSVIVLSLFVSSSAWAQMNPTEYIWARNTDDNIVLDGKLDESAWNDAETKHIMYGENAGNPGSGYRSEGGVLTAPTDPVDATLRFLADGNQLYIAATVQDSSIGGSVGWARWDVILMGIIERSDKLGNPTRVVHTAEYFYGWWYAGLGMPEDSVGIGPRLTGDFAPFDTTYRTPEQIQAWETATTVQGVTNSDSEPDTSYTVEMRIDLTEVGYDATGSGGTVVLWNASIWDTDWFWPQDENKHFSGRVWWQDPWGNTTNNSLVRIYVDPDVTTSTSDLPVPEEEVIIPENTLLSSPTIDGELNETVWQFVESRTLRYGDNQLRQSYDKVESKLYGWFQPPVNDTTADVLDPAEGDFRWFFDQSNTNPRLYFSVDVSDQVVQSSNEPNIQDGAYINLFNIKERRDADSVMVHHNIGVYVDSTGSARLGGYAKLLADSMQKAEFALSLKDGTTVDDQSDIDEGYVIEGYVDLTAFGYSQSLENRRLYISARQFDGDIFEDPSKNYGNQAYWHMNQWNPHPAYAYMSSDVVVDIEDEGLTKNIPDKIKLRGAYPNPFNPSTNLKYAIPADGEVTVSVYNILGRKVQAKNLGIQKAGAHQVRFDGSNLASGVYLYRVELERAADNQTIRSNAERMTLIK